MVNDEMFVKQIQEGVKQLLGKKFQIDIEEARKNNGVVLTALIIGCAGTTMRKIVYLEDFYTEYQHGRKICDIVDWIADNCCNAEADYIGIQDVYDFFKIRQKIMLRLVNFEKNKETLEKMPYVRFHDLAVVFYILLETHRERQYTTLIYNELLNYWGMTTSDLMSLALVNSRKRLKISFRSMKDVMLDLAKEVGGVKDEMMEEVGTLDNDSEPMYILTNCTGMFGAAVLLYPGVLHDIANYLGDDLIVLPSSVHETIIVKYEAGACLRLWREIVISANENNVKPEDYLSDNVYVFRRSKGELELVEKNDIARL